MKQLVRPGDVVWDVGANIGFYSRIFAQCFKAKRVYAFEPMSDNLPELRYNLRIGQVEDRVTVMPLALSNTDGVADFQVDDMQSASGALDVVYGGKACRARAALGLPPVTEKVTCCRLDTLLASGEVLPPDVIKVDIEGAERLFLEGGQEFFAKHAPRVLIETHGVEVMKECLQFLFDNGYQIAGCVPPSWNATRHQRVFPEVLARISGEYDVHIILAAKNAQDLPLQIENDISQLLNT